MPHVTAIALSIFLLFLPVAVIAQEAIGREPSLEEIEALDANFGPDDYAAMRARYSDKIPKPPGPVTPATLAGKADLVIEGTVRDIYYTYEGDFKQPYTHTVIDVTRVLQGEHTESTLSRKLHAWQQRSKILHRFCIDCFKPHGTNPWRARQSAGFCLSSGQPPLATGYDREKWRSHFSMYCSPA